ncbi:semaphorin-1A-like [Anneissia japonica]|uniref:semaphorin-1A-like n=1 Tax=Anneissia japonica TaxID=1529436 RepID=UPI00142575AA|nr:semaphorin-1A-like [Anneissia japonica]
MGCLTCSAIFVTIAAMTHFEACVGENMKRTLLGSDIFDLSITEDEGMRYRLLSIENNTLFVGGKNKLIAIPLNLEMERNFTTKFNVCEPFNDLECSKQNKKDACFNYIRVFKVMNDNKIFVCGSNALYPRCYYLKYEISDNNEWVITGMEDTFECNRWDKAYHSGVDFTPFTWNSEMVHEFSGELLLLSKNRKVH